LGDHPNVLEWRIERSLNTAKGTVIVEVGSFADQAALEEFRGSDLHHEIGEFMASICDKWLVGDYLEG
jgi:hypothetical protein